MDKEIKLDFRLPKEQIIQITASDNYLYSLTTRNKVYAYVGREWILCSMKGIGDDFVEVED